MQLYLKTKAQQALSTKSILKFYLFIELKRRKATYYTYFIFLENIIHHKLSKKNSLLNIKIDK